MAEEIDKQKQTKDMVNKFTDIGKISDEWDVKELGYFLDYVQPTNYISKNIEELKSNTNCIPVLTAGKSFVLGYTVDNDKSFKKLPIILFDDFTTDNKYVDFPFQIRSSAAKILVAKKDVHFNFKFVFNAMQQINFISSDHKRYWISEYQLLTIPCPSFKEQQKIATILSTWDDAIDKCKVIIENLKNRNKGLLKVLLNSEKLKIVKPFLKEVSLRNKDLKVKRILSVTNSKGFINQIEQFNRVVASKDLSNYKIIIQNQFAYNPARINVGSLDLLKTFDNGILSPMYVVFKTNESYLLTSYFFYCLKSSTFKNSIQNFLQGSVRNNLTFDALCSMKFSIPSLQTQQKITQILDKAFEESKHFENLLKYYQHQKKGLMQQLLTGKKRVNYE